jgi:hypothetical protein
VSFIGVLRSVHDGERRHHRSPALARTPAGRDPEQALASPVEHHITALLGPECQSFVDNLLAKIRAWRSSNNQQ